MLSFNTIPSRSTHTCSRTFRSADGDLKTLWKLITNYLEQAASQQLRNQLMQVSPKSFVVHFVFSQQFFIRGLDRVRPNQPGPHSCAHLIEAEVVLILKIEQYRLIFNL